MDRGVEHVVEKINTVWCEGCFQAKLGSVVDCVNVGLLMGISVCKFSCID